MDLIIERSAFKVLIRIQPKLAAAIRDTLSRIAEQPYAHHANVTRLKGVRDSFRLRHGDWRVIYRIDRAGQQVVVEEVTTRGDAYR